MAMTTDPAREISDFCNTFRKTTNERGDAYLAKTFGTEPWSSEFFLILNAYLQRTQLVLAVLDRLPLDEDNREELREHVRTLESLCSPEVLRRSWNNQGGGQSIVRGSSRAAIATLSVSIRPIIHYPLISEEERQQVLGEVELVLEKLRELQLSEQDFVRQALIDGLTQFHFRLERLNWLGWGYTIEGLRDVISAYVILERGFPEAQANPSAATVLKYTRHVFAKIRDVTGMASDAKDGLDLALIAFQAIKVGGPFIAGLLAAHG